jgi:fermentation-respiration switch protein FrsA (DUF1100 family)
MALKRVRVLNLVVAIVLVWVAFTALAWWTAEKYIFMPPPPSYTAAALGVQLIDAGDGARIATLYLPNSSARFTLLYSHGNAEDLGNLAPLLARLRGAGFAVLAYDYRGYGASSSGPPTETGVYQDEHAVYHYATDQLHIPAERIIAHGRSVGSGPAAELAASERLGGLILESGFVSAYRELTRIRIIPFDRFDNLARLSQVQCPVLVIHGRRDIVVPFWHGEALFAAAHEPKRALWLDAGHNDILVAAGPLYLQGLQDFAQQLR